jgi:hypothetical protein
LSLHHFLIEQVVPMLDDHLGQCDETLAAE